MLKKKKKTRRKDEEEKKNYEWSETISVFKRFIIKHPQKSGEKKL